MVVAADGSLLIVYRTDGGDGWPDHQHKPFMKVKSSDQGHTWSSPVSLPSGVLSARPQMLMLTPSGPLLLTGGRPLLMLWMSADGNGDAWEAYNIAGQHNAKVADQSLKYCEAFANGTLLLKGAAGIIGIVGCNDFNRTLSTSSLVSVFVIVLLTYGCACLRRKQRHI